MPTLGVATALTTALLAAVPRPGSAPRWSLEELRTVLVQIGDAGAKANISEKDSALAAVASRAYGARPRGEGEALDRFARRVVKRRAPDHPNVKQGQWLGALMRQLYADIAGRAKALARFERDRKTRQWLEERQREAESAVAILGRELEVEIEGLEGVVALPPRVGGDPPTFRGAKAEVAGGRLIVERLPRARLTPSGRVEDGAPRTRSGSVRELYSALRQYDTTAAMLGRYDPDWRKKRGHIQAILPASAPASLLNELVRAALEAKMRVVHLVTLDGKGQPRELPLYLRPHRRKTSVEVGCADGEPLSDCARTLAHAHLRGRVLYRLP